MKIVKLFFNKFYCPLLVGLVFSLYGTNYGQSIINLDSTHQRISGFGAANILPWRPDMVEDEIEKAFGTGDGQIGFSILRLRVPSDENSFSLNLPTAISAHEMGVKLIASPWSPPAFMKTNNNIVGGELSESYYADYAAHLKEFADYMAENGAPIYAISVQNEPDISVNYESCDWDANQMLKFVKENAQSIGTKVIAPESFHFDKAFSNPILNDPDAAANLDIVGGHIYGGGLEAYPLAQEKGKEIWMTEHLILGTNWADNLSTGRDINKCMYYGMSAYIWWYIVRFYGPIYDDGSHADTPPEAVPGEISKRGFVMSQFSRFVRPGFHRVECTYTPQNNVNVTAYKDSASSNIVIVAINTSTQTKNQTFVMKNGSADMFIPYVTSETKNCVQENSLSVIEGSFTATLEQSSITTFVSPDNTSSIENQSSIPETFKLFQNYPNPFNPTTVINYHVPQVSYVSLKIYDALGREVDVLANEEKSAGSHSVTWDANGLAGGVYLCRLIANDLSASSKQNYEDVKKLILLK